jgi:hypothetical protein
LVEDDLDSVKDCYYPEEIVVPSRMEQIRREQSVDLKQLERQSAGSRDVEGEEVVLVHFATAAAAAVSDSTVESILQVKRVEVVPVSLKQVEVELVSVFPLDPDPKYIDIGGKVVAVAAAVPEQALAPIHFDLHLVERLIMMTMMGVLCCYSFVANVE